ncbi:MAG: beta-lactamase family protein, partial [Candidatus Dadabacteria bacterium]|nr:beta-lactamase family protein [Candidatus Dadabacteria bacterium]
MRNAPLMAFAVFALTLVLSCDKDKNSLDPGIEAELRQIVSSYREEFGIPGILAGVWIPGQGRLVIEDGVSDIETDAPIKKDDHVRIGSVTKSFTVTVILQLVEEGLISLDDPVGDYLPGVENADATIAELANMRSGIFNYTEDADFVTEFVESDFLRVWTDQELVDYADANVPYFPPDGGWHYSNTNTVILGMIAEQATGRTIGEEITDRIIAPLGLGGTSYPTTPDMPEPFARGYGFEPPEDVSFTDPSSSAGSGAMISRLGDLKKWGEALGSGSLLTSELQAERINSLSPIVYDPCDDDDPDREKRSCPEYDEYGLGIGELSGWIGHTGESVGYPNLVMYEPVSGSVVV